MAGDRDRYSGVEVAVEGPWRARWTGRLLFGLVMVSLGTLWTLDNLGIADAGQVLRWWPALLDRKSVV